MKSLPMVVYFFIYLPPLGFLLSLYAYITELKIKAYSDYKPLCDLSDRVSCSKVMNSPYSKIFLFSNAVWGMLFYAAAFILLFFSGFWRARVLLAVLIIISFLVTCYLAYLLYFKIRTICMVCTSLYVINILLFISVIQMIFFL